MYGYGLDMPGIDSIMQSGEASIGMLAGLNKALRDAGLQKASAGYPQQGVAYTGDFQPLMPQSIQNTLDSATYTEKHVVLWKKLSKVSVGSTLHEATLENTYGDMQLDPFVVEGELGSTSEAEYARQVVKVKYLAEQATLTDVATMVGVIGPNGINKNGLAMKTLSATRALLGKLERALFLADEDVSALHFSGLYAQITKQQASGSAYASGVHTINASRDNYQDLRGASLTPQNLIDAVFRVAAEPNYGMADTILVEPRVYSLLSQYAIPFGRTDLKATGTIVSFGESGIGIVGPSGPVRIEIASLLMPEQSPVSGSKGSSAPTLVSGDIATAVAADADATNAFATADIGAYRYKIQAVGDRGLITVDVTTTATITAAGQKVTFTISDSAKPTSGDASIRFYRVFRSPIGGGLGTTTFMWQYPRAASGTDTIIVDQNKHLPKCSPVYIFQNTPDVIYWTQLLDFMRRPIPVSKPSVQFLVMLFGALFMKNRKRGFVIDNVRTVS